MEPNNIRLAGQNRTILNHLRKHGSITPLQAIGLYGVYRLAAVIYRLRAKGVDVTTADKRDPNGHPYAEYRLSRKASAAIRIAA